MFFKKEMTLLTYHRLHKVQTLYEMIKKSDQFFILLPRFIDISVTLRDHRHGEGCTVCGQSFHLSQRSLVHGANSFSILPLLAPCQPGQLVVP